MIKSGLESPGDLPYSLTGSGVVWENGRDDSIIVREVHVPTHPQVCSQDKVVTVLDGTGALEYIGRETYACPLTPGEVHFIPAGTNYSYTPFVGTLFVKEEKVGAPIPIEGTTNELDSD